MSVSLDVAAFTSPRLRGEVGSSLAMIRVRGNLRESECVESSPHPNPLPASGQRETEHRRLCSQPPLPSLEALQILETLALVARAAEVEFLDVFVVAQLGGRAVEHHLALFHDVAVACDRKGGARVLLHQQDGDAEVAVDLLDQG